MQWRAVSPEIGPKTQLTTRVEFHAKVVVDKDANTNDGLAKLSKGRHSQSSSYRSCESCCLDPDPTKKAYTDILSLTQELYDIHDHDQ